ncbi:MAG TPA: ATP-binding protein [Limnobacter sp.]|nr:ATP-binding protein [Limnobacter sp.]
MQTHNNAPWAETEKMASIGALAAGVAHEINNPIGFVGSNMNTLRAYLGDILQVLGAYTAAKGDPELLRAADALAGQVDLNYLQEDILILMDECREGLVRVQRVVQDLKNFSHSGQGQWCVTDVHKSLESSLQIVHHDIKHKAQVIRDYGDLPLITCMASQLNQVFLNLLINAAHAIESRGCIQVQTRQTEGWVCVTIRDDGHGISQDNLARVFDPFFTTKPIGQGTGLGLAVSYGIVKQHGGRIEVQSQAGRGSAFTVWLPMEPVQACSSGDQHGASRGASVL